MAVSVVSLISAESATAATFPGTWTPATNDVVVFFISSTVATATADADPAGWVNVLGSAVEVVSDSHMLCCFYHKVTSGEATAVTRTYTATFMTGGTGPNIHGVVLRGVDPTTPLDNAVSILNSGNAITPHTLPALVGANLSTDSLVVGCVTKDGTGTYTNPTGWTQIVAGSTNQGKYTGSRDALTISGTAVASTNITPSAGDEYCAINSAWTVLAVAAAPRRFIRSGRVPVRRKAFY